jgi:hypothetical protein
MMKIFDSFCVRRALFFSALVLISIDFSSCELRGRVQVPQKDIDFIHNKDPTLNSRFLQGDINISNNTNNGTNTTKSKRNLATVPFTNQLWNDDLRQGYFWITVRISNSYTLDDKEKIKSALRDLQWRSQVIRFEFIYEMPNPLIPHLHIKNEPDGCWSSIGHRRDKSMTAEGQQINLEGGSIAGCTTTRSVQHEMMHALGFGHEQSRPDRDNYVDIIWDNIMDDMKPQFNKVHSSDSLGTDYDFNSIMHYPSNAWAKNDGDLTIVPKYGKVIEYRPTATWTDILQIRLMYQCTSGPRYLLDYNTQTCSPDCQCWHNQAGCGNDDSSCNDDLVCQDNKCVHSTADIHLKNLTQQHMNGESYLVTGAMFDIQAKDKPIIITNLYYQGINQDVHVDVYTKEWTHFKWSENESKWQLIGSAFLQSRQDDKAELIFPTDAFNQITLSKWSRRGFYIQTKHCGNNCSNLRVWKGYNYSQSDHPFIENDSAKMLKGCPLRGRFDNGYQLCSDQRGGDSYTFWGGVQYRILYE